MYVLLHNNKSGLYAMFICSDQNAVGPKYFPFTYGEIRKHYFYVEQLNVYGK